MPSEHMPSLEVGYADRPKGRSPWPADQPYNTSRSLEAAYDDRSVDQKAWDGISKVLKDDRVLLGSAAVTAGNLYELQYNLFNIPGVQDHPEALAAAAGLGGAVVFYNAASRTAGRAYDAVVPRTAEAVNRLLGREQEDVDPLLEGIQDYADLEELLDGEPETVVGECRTGTADPSEAAFYASLDELASDEGWVRDRGGAPVRPHATGTEPAGTDRYEAEEPEELPAFDELAADDPADVEDDHENPDYSDDEIEQAMQDAARDLDPDGYREMAGDVEEQLEEADSDTDEDEEEA